MRFGYLPTGSPVHGLNPLTKFAFLCVVGLLTFILPRRVELVSLLALVVLTAGLARVLGAWLRFMRMAMLPAFVITVVNVLMSPYHGDRMVFAAYQGSNEVLLHYELGFLTLTVTSYSVQKGILLGLRWLGLVAPAGVFIYTTKPEDFAASLSRLRVPYTIAFAIGAALRLIPSLIQDTETILSAQRSRGLDWDGGPIRRLRALPTIVFPLIGCSIRRATEMAAAMEARAYGAIRVRTLCYPARFSPKDVCWLGVAGVMLALGVVSRIAIR